MSLLGACGGGAGSGGATSQGVDPLVQDYGIAYVKRPVPAMDTADARVATTFIAGGDLYYRDLASPSASERNITFRVTGGQGDVKDVEASFDGSKLIFALRLPDIEGADPEDQPSWNIWEYDIQADQLRRVISSDITAEAGQDVAPHYLPDGRIIFSSSRQRKSKAILLDEGKPQYAALDENRNEHALVLHVMNSDGSNIAQVSFNQSHDLDPTVLQSGEVVFSRWDNMGSSDAISLYKMNPDGTNLQLLYGANSHDTGSNGSTVQFLQPREMPDGRIMVVLKPYTGTRQGGDIVTIDVTNYIENTQPTAQNQGVLTGPAQASASVNVISTEASPSPGGRFISVYPLWDGTNRALVSWSQCRLLENGNIVPCTASRLADPAVQEAPPLYSLFLYDMDSNTQLPIFTPQEGFMYTDVVAAQPRQLPNIIFDKQPGVDVSQSLADENAGILNIRSVYDFDGSYNALGGTRPDIATLADPQQTTADERPARFLRVVKAVGIPDRNTKQLDGSAFGRSTGQLMREIIGYAPIEPDGSVKVKVPANVPLAISLLDKDGRRIGSRHTNWLQVRPGEVVSCNGCHSPTAGMSHGRADAFLPLHSGAPFDGYQYPNTVGSIFANFGETMAEARTRLDATALNPTVDIVYNDAWTDPVAAGRAADTPFSYAYSDLDPAIPAPVSSPGCLTTWTTGCRIVINYERNIHPLWARDRGANTCTGCHAPTDAAGNPRVPDAQLDLTDGASDQNPDHFKAYRELLFNDNEQEVSGGVLADILVQATDADGNPLFQTDANGDPILDSNGNMIPIMVTVNVSPSMSVNGAAASTRFFSIFAPGGTHDGRLDPVELKLLAEWLDIGGQYYNNPFDAP